MAIVGQGAQAAVVPGDGQRARCDVAVSELEVHARLLACSVRPVDVVDPAAPAPDHGAAHIRQSPARQCDRVGGVAHRAGAKAGVRPLEAARAVVAQLVPLAARAVGGKGRAWRGGRVQGDLPVEGPRLLGDRAASAVGQLQGRPGRAECGGLAARVGGRRGGKANLATRVVHHADHRGVGIKLAAVVRQHAARGSDRQRARVNRVAQSQHCRRVEGHACGVAHRAVVRLHRAVGLVGGVELQQRDLGLRAGHDLAENRGDLRREVLKLGRLGQAAGAVVRQRVGLDGVAQHRVVAIAQAAKQVGRRRAREVKAQLVHQLAAHHQCLVRLA